MSKAPSAGTNLGKFLYFFILSVPISKSVLIFLVTVFRAEFRNVPYEQIWAVEVVPVSLSRDLVHTFFFVGVATQVTTRALCHLCVLHIHPILFPVDIQHTQGPWDRVIVLERLWYNIYAVTKPRHIDATLQCRRQSRASGT